MAWSCSSSSNSGLIANMQAASLVSSPTVAAAMAATDRAFYCPPSASPYEDAPQRIGHGATISAPHMHAMCLELIAQHASPAQTTGAQPSTCPAPPSMSMLDVGSGSGYITVAAARLRDSHGRPLLQRVIGIDHSPDLVSFSLANFARDSASASPVPVAAERVQARDCAAAAIFCCVSHASPHRLCSLWWGMDVLVMQPRRLTTSFTSVQRCLKRCCHSCCSR